MPDFFQLAQAIGSGKFARNTSTTTTTNNTWDAKERDMVGKHVAQVRCETVDGSADNES